MIPVIMSRADISQNGSRERSAGISVVASASASSHEQTKSNGLILSLSIESSNGAHLKTLPFRRRIQASSR